MERDRAQSHGCLLPTAASRLGVRHTLRSLRVNVEEMKAEVSDSVWIKRRHGKAAPRPVARAPVPHSPAAQSANPGQSLDFPEPHFLISKNGILIPNRAARTSERIQDFNQLRKVLGPR